MMARSSRLALFVFVVVLASTAVFVFRTAILRSVGWALVADDPVTRADLIVVSVDAGSAGLLEAADLVHGGIAMRLAVFADSPNDSERELIRRGVQYDNAAVRYMGQLRLLGVANVEEIPNSMADAGTSEEGRVLSEWLEQHSFRSVVVVCTRDHSRRFRRVLDRAMKGRATSVTIRPARHSPFDPDRWWQTNAGLRTGIIELQKLALDVARHPLS
jgi:hypothetical protein